MSVESKKYEVTEESYKNLLAKYESVQEKLKVSVLKNKEYEKEVRQLQEQTSQLTAEITSYKELAQAEARVRSPTSDLISTLDECQVNNLDLNTQIKEYKQYIKQIKSENNQLKKENEQYKIAMETNNKLKQKREETYTNNKQKLENKINSLQQECDALNQEIAALFLNLTGRPSGKHIPRAASNDSISSPQEFKHMKDRTLILQGLSLGALIADQSLSTTQAQHDVYQRLSVRQSSVINAVPSKIGVTPNGYDKMNDGFIDIEDGTDILYEDDTGSEYKIDQSADFGDLGVYGRESGLLGVGTVGLVQSTTKGTDNKDLVAKIEEINQLKEMGEEKELLIKKLKQENKAFDKRVKALKRQNNELFQKLRGPFSCGSFRGWFS